MGEIKTQIRIASLLIALGIICGAFGAHALKPLLTQQMMAIYEKAVFYHLITAVGMLIVSLLMSTESIGEKTGRTAFRGLLLGIIFFSGSLYVLSVTGAMWLGALTPIGGVLFIASWVLIALR